MTRALVAVAPVAVVAALCVPARAQAQTMPATMTTTGVAAERFVPALGPASLFGVEGAAVTAPGQLSFAVGLDLLHDPITLTTVNSGAPLTQPVRDQLVGDLALEVGFWKRLALGVGVPVVLYQDGERLQGTGTDERPLHAEAAGDLRVRLKGQLVGDAAKPGLHAALILQVTAPMGGQSDFAATDGATIEPLLVGDWRVRRVMLAATVGARFQRDRSLFQTQFGDELLWSAGLGALVVERGRFAGTLVFESAGAVGPSSGTRPVELRGGVRLGIGRFAVDAGAGGGVNDSVGAPAWRVFLVARGTVGVLR